MKRLILLCLLTSLALAGGVWSPGLVGSWSMESNDSLRDGSGNGNKGFRVGSVVTAGNFGNCDSFAGASSSYDTIPHRDVYDSLPLTISFRIRSAASPLPDWTTLAEDYASNNGWYFTTQSNWYKFGYGVGTPSIDLTNICAVNTLPHFLAVVVETTGLTTYSDAVLAATRAWTGTAASKVSTAHITAGKNPDNYAYFTGTIDEIQVWHRALTQQEIQNVMMGDTPEGGE